MEHQPAPSTAVRTRNTDSATVDETTSSPARGRETRTALLQKLRPPPLVHAWDFWFEKENSSNTTTTLSKASSASSSTTSTTPQSTKTANISSTATNSTPPSTSTSIITSSSPSPSSSNTNNQPQTLTTPHNTTLTHLHSITNVQHFWSLFNNFSFSTLPPRASVHLFHLSIHPTWEHPRNTQGGALTFRLPRPIAGPFFRALALLAIGEQLQEAVVRVEGRRDDVCGISFAVKSERVCAVAVWTRDSGNEVGRTRLVECIMRNLPKELRPMEGSWCYKPHADNAGFRAEPTRMKKDEGKVEPALDKQQDVSDAVANLSREYEKVRQILEEVKLGGKEMEERIGKEERGHV